MQPIRNWSKIWKIERVFYKISNEISLPRPVTQTFLIWFLLGFMLSLRMDGIFPFVFDSALVNRLALPFFLAFFMNKRTFQGRKPYNYLFSILRFALRPKRTRRGKWHSKNRTIEKNLVVLTGERINIL